MKNGFLISKEGKSIPEVPKRIISLVPSQTELLYDLGLEQQVVGITKFCIHPDSWFRSKTRVGGTKNVDVEKVKALNPDLILANKEENDQRQIEQLANIVPVYVSDIHTLKDALNMIRQIGLLTGTTEKTQHLAQDIRSAFQFLRSPNRKRPSAAYLIWRKPWMSVGKDTFIHSIMELAGFQNIFSDQNRYPEINLADIEVCKPDVVLLSSEPYPFKEKHIAEVQEAIPGARILLVDGEPFSWYGSRLLQAPAYLERLQVEIQSTA